MGFIIRSNMLDFLQNIHLIQITFFKFPLLSSAHITFVFSWFHLFSLSIILSFLSSQALYYSFTPPLAMPETICFWNNKTIIKVGIVTIAAAAVICPQ